MAVYTKVSDNAVTAFLRDYNLGDFVSLTGIKAGVSNSNFLLETTQGPHILTVYESRTREEDLPFYLELTEYLANKGVPCAIPIRTKSGIAVNHLVGKPAALISFLTGRPLARVTREASFELGVALADLHTAGQGFSLRRVNDLSLTGWEAIFKACEERADEVQQGLADELSRELIYLRTYWPDQLPFGVIHADLFPDNVFFAGDKLCGLIDFYFACNDILAYDLAVCLNSWCFESNNMSFNITKAQALLQGYASRRILTPEETRSLPLLCRGAAIRFLLTRLYDWLHQVPGALVKAKDPREYLARLKFHQKVSDISSYGLSE